jgi:hypothetical protein
MPLSISAPRGVHGVVVCCGVMKAATLMRVISEKKEVSDDGDEFRREPVQRVVGQFQVAVGVYRRPTAPMPELLT